MSFVGKLINIAVRERTRGTASAWRRNRSREAGGGAGRRRDGPAGMVVGLGTGSTAEFAIHALGERVASGSTSSASRRPRCAETAGAFLRHSADRLAVGRSRRPHHRRRRRNRAAHARGPQRTGWRAGARKARGHRVRRLVIIADSSKRRSRWDVITRCRSRCSPSVGTSRRNAEPSLADSRLANDLRRHRPVRRPTTAT